MKRTLLHLVTALSALIITASIAAAENNSPPDKMTFQGFLTDATQEGGPPLGATTPVNVTLTFRIYAAATGGNARWAEQQIVTVDNGHFSVLLGEGIPVSPTPVTTLAEVFTKGNASERYIGITVKPESGEEQPEIAPRLQFFPSPYAHLAGTANSLVSGAGATIVNVTAAGRVGVGVANPLASLDVDGSIGLRGANELKFGTDLTNPSYIKAWWSDNNNTGLEFHTFGQGADTLAMKIDNLGTVAMGAGLHVKGLSLFDEPITLKSSGGWLSLVAGGNGGTDYVALGNLADRATIAANTQAGVATHLSINPNGGNVGIGISAPSASLHISGPAIPSRASSEVQEVLHLSRPGAVGESKGSHAAIGLSFYEDPSANYPRTRVDFRTSGKANDAATAPNTVMSLRDDGNVGIGTTAPGATLHISGDGAFTGSSQAKVLDLFSGGSYRIGYDHGGSGRGYIRHNIVAGAATDTWGHAIGHSLTSTPDTFVTDMFVSATGNVGIGTSAPSHGKLNVKGNIAVESLGIAHVWSIYAGSTGDGSFHIHRPGVAGTGGYLPYNGGGWTINSDRRVKKDIVRQENLLPRVLKLEPVSFRYKDAPADSPKQLGFIAQDVELQFPELVPDVDGKKMLQEGNLISVAIGAIQELAARVDHIQPNETRIKELEEKAARVDSLEQKVSALEKLVARLATPETQPRPTAAVENSNVQIAGK